LFNVLSSKSAGQIIFWSTLLCNHGHGNLSQVLLSLSLIYSKFIFEL